MKRLLATLAVTLLLAGPAAAQVTRQAPSLIPNYFTNLTIPSVIVTNTYSNLVSQPIYINPGYGVAVSGASTNGENATTLSNITVTAQVSADGTNYVDWVTGTFDSGSVWATNWALGWFDGFRTVRIGKITNNDTNNDVTLGPIRMSRARMNLDQIRK